MTPLCAAVVVLEGQYRFLSTTASTFTWVSAGNIGDVTSWSSYHLLLLAALWLSQLLLTCHVWTPTSGRMEKIQKYRIQNTENRIQNTKYTIPNTQYRIHNT